MKIYYIHGFNSYKGSSTPKKLRQALGMEVQELYYASQQTFEEIMTDLRAQYDASNAAHEPSVIAGTSMGGFFADQLCDMPDVMAVVMINPVVDPVEVLSKETFLGEQENFITHEKYMFSKAIAETYGSYRDMRKVDVRRFLMVAAHDELLDASVSEAYWGGCSRIIRLEGGHRLTDFGAVARILASLIPEDDAPNERYAG